MRISMRYTARFCLTAVLLLSGTGTVSAQISNEECLSCHDKVEASKFGASVHGPLECTNCHADVTAVPHEPKPKAVNCATCHTDVVAAWESSLHATAVRTGIARGARCADCHGSPHEILPSNDRRSPTFHTAIPTTCSRCH